MPADRGLGQLKNLHQLRDAQLVPLEQAQQTQTSGVRKVVHADHQQLWVVGDYHPSIRLNGYIVHPARRELQLQRGGQSRGHREVPERLDLPALARVLHVLGRLLRLLPAEVAFHHPERQVDA